MKKLRFITIIGMAVIMMFTAIAFIGCSDGRQPAITGQNTRYAVFSNGGSAVQFGNFVYFVNGHGGFADPNADANRFGQVEKGALYRARLMGNSVQRYFNFWYNQRDAQGNQIPTPLWVFDNVIDDFSQMEFYTDSERIIEYQRDERGEYLYDEDGYRIPIEEGPFEYRHTAQLDRMAGKRIGQENTSVGGGIFILGEWIFFSSPHNLRDGAGVVHTTRTDFFRLSLDGSRMHLIYTTVNHRTDDGTPIPVQYAFHKWNGSYYLLVLDGDEIISVEMDRGGSRIRSPRTIAQNVTSAYFPVREIYYNGINENTVENFIYWTRSPVGGLHGDTILRGNVIEMMRPDGSERIMIYNGGQTATIMGTDNGLFFYSAAVIQGVAAVTTVHYHNFHDLLLGGRFINGEFRPNPNNTLFSPTYRAFWTGRSIPFSNIAGTISRTEFNQATNLVAIRPNHHNAECVYVLAFGGDGVRLFSKAGTPVLLTSRSAEFVAYNGHGGFTHAVRNAAGNPLPVWDVYGGWTLFLRDGSSFFSVNLFGGGNERTIGTGFSGGPPSFRLDILPSFAVFFANAPDISARATNYAWFIRLDDVYAEPMLIAYVIYEEREDAPPIIGDED